VSAVPSNEGLIRALRDAVSAAAGIAVMDDCSEMSALARSARTFRLRTIRQALEWAIADLSVPELEARDKAA
jgi:hypothetical protein